MIATALTNLVFLKMLTLASRLDLILCKVGRLFSLLASHTRERVELMSQTRGRRRLSSRGPRLRRTTCLGWSAEMWFCSIVINQVDVSVLRLQVIRAWIRSSLSPLSQLEPFLGSKISLGQQNFESKMIGSKKMFKSKYFGSENI